MATLNDKIRQLENQIKSMQAKILDLSNKTEIGRKKTESTVPLRDDGRTAPIPSTGTGLGKLPGKSAGIIWNDADAMVVPWGQQPPTPTKGYNKHGHSRYAGGALDINTLELVEYEFDSQNPHCQSYWKDLPKIAKDGDVEKIGLLDITFDKISKKWLAGGIIDVEKTNIVQKDEDGNILTDNKGQEMKAPINGEDENSKNSVWDENAKCWRFYAVFADEEEE